MKLCLACEQPFDAESWLCPHCGHSPAFHSGPLAFSPDPLTATEGYPQGRHAQLALLEKGHFWFESRNRLITWALRRYFPDAKNFLEIGCGTGFVLSCIHQQVPRLTVSGGETSIEALALARTRLPGVSLYQMDAQRIPFQCEFDVIGAFDVLEHIEEDMSVLGQMFRSTRPGGGILITAPQHPWLWSTFDEEAFHRRRYTRGQLRGKVVKAGFEIIRTVSFVSLLLPAMILSRMTPAKPGEHLDSVQGYQLRRRLNALLEKILRIEMMFITRGGAFPVGGSLLMIARRPSR